MLPRLRSAALGVTHRLLSVGRRTPIDPPATVLVLQQQNPLGYCVHNTPLPAALKQRVDPPTVVIATRRIGLETLQHNPHVDLLIETPDPLASGGVRVSVRAIRSALRSRGLAPDLILQDVSNLSGTLSLLAALLRLAPVAGFGQAPGLYDNPLVYDRDRSLLDNNLRLAEFACAPSTHREPEVWASHVDAAYARALLTECNPEAKPVIAFILRGSGGQLTAWREERSAEVVRHAAKLGFLPIYLGMAADADAIARVAEAAGVGVSLAGRSTIPQAAALLALMDAAVTIDTGTMHVARAVQLPMVVLATCWQRQTEWMPLGCPQAIVVQGPEIKPAPSGYQLDDIETPRVIAAVDSLLSEFPPDPAERERRLARILSNAAPPVVRL